MIVLKSRSELRELGGRPVVLTIGNFDGVHRGHRTILARVTERARALGAVPAVLSFHPHPLRVLVPERAPRLMQTGEQKRQLFEEHGIEAYIELPFDRALANMPAESFVREILAEGIGVREIYIGPDFRFGRGRAGDVDLLARMGEELGFAAEGIEPVMDGQVRISASHIRELLGRGEVEEAARLLGRPFTLIGTVVHGEGRGSEILVPTANLAPENQFLPARGVYVTRTRRGDDAILGLTNVGIRPTFGYRRIVVETFLLDFEGDLYGERVELELLAHVRDERKFDNPQALMEQIQLDIAFFRQWTAENA